MTRKAAIALAVLAVAANAAELSMQQGTVTAGKPASLDVKVSVGKDSPTGFQFDLEYDAAALDVTVDGGPVAQQASKNVRTAQIRAGKLRVLIIGFNRTTISDGVLAVVHVALKGGEAGKTFPVQMTGASGTNANAETIGVTVKDGSVRVEK